MGAAVGDFRGGAFIKFEETKFMVSPICPFVCIFFFSIVPSECRSPYLSFIRIFFVSDSLFFLYTVTEKHGIIGCH